MPKAKTKRKVTTKKKKVTGRKRVTSSIMSKKKRAGKGRTGRPEAEM